MLFTIYFPEFLKEENYLKIDSEIVMFIWLSPVMFDVQWHGH